MAGPPDPGPEEGLAQNVLGVNPRRQGRVNPPPEHRQQARAMCLERLGESGDLADGRRRFLLVTRTRHETPHRRRWRGQTITGGREPPLSLTARTVEDLTIPQQKILALV